MTRTSWRGCWRTAFVERFLEGSRLDAAAAAVGDRRRAGAGPVQPRRCAWLDHPHHRGRWRRAAAPASPARTGPDPGLVVPGTGVHVNNMLGEEDLNPLGFHRHRPGHADALDDVADGRPARRRAGGRARQRRLEPDPLGGPADGHPPGRRGRAGLGRRRGSAGALRGRRRSTPSPGSTRPALERLAGRGYEVIRWPDSNVFFGGVHAVARDPGSGAMRGAGDPRRGGAVAYA